MLLAQMSDNAKSQRAGWRGSEGVGRSRMLGNVLSDLLAFEGRRQGAEMVGIAWNWWGLGLSWQRIGFWSAAC